MHQRYVNIHQMHVVMLEESRVCVMKHWSMNSFVTLLQMDVQRMMDVVMQHRQLCVCGSVAVLKDQDIIISLGVHIIKISFRYHT